MREIESLRHELEREAILLSGRVGGIKDALHQLRRLTLLRFAHVRPDPAEIDAWLAKEGFERQPTGFFERTALLERLRRGEQIPNEHGIGWPHDRKDDPHLRTRMFALRDFTQDLREIHEGLSGVAWMYYQDVGNAMIEYPPVDMSTVVPADFDWSTYYPWLVTGPAANPERAVRWTAPTVDYAGEGLIVTASIPLWAGDSFIGLWSIDVPVRYLHNVSFSTPAARGQVNFIADRQGNLVMHPHLVSLRDAEKGAIYNKKLADAGGDFTALDIAHCLSTQKGELRLRDGQGVDLVCLYYAVRDVDWLMFSAFPAEDILDVVKQPSEGLYAPFTDVLPGAVLDGKYRLDEMLGSGGFGVVYRGTQLSLERKVAIKIFRPPGEKTDASLLGRFLLEGVSACRVQHPNAVAVLDSGVSSSGVPYLVMELLEGCTLSQDMRRRGGRLSPRRALEIARVVASVLASAHAAGIVHRDIKPDNVYLHDEGSGQIVKVLDFGIAKIERGEGMKSDFTMTGQVLGTPVYIAPERFTGAEVDGRSDVYSLGVLLHEMIAGKPPFQIGDEGPWRVMSQHMNEPPPPLRSIDPSVPAEVESLVLLMMRKRPADRPEASELAVTIEVLCAHLWGPASQGPRSEVMRLMGEQGDRAPIAAEELSGPTSSPNATTRISELTRQKREPLDRRPTERSKKAKDTP